MKEEKNIAPLKIGKEQKKLERSWILYDCANSAYSIAVTTALFPILFGMYKGESMTLGYFNSIASIIITIISPILGTIADYKDKKKRFFLFFFFLGVLTTAALALVPAGEWKILVIFYVLSGVGFAGANTFYDAFLVDVTTDERMDAVSSKGYAYGYIMSIIPFGISLALIYKLGMNVALGYQVGFMITALWWGLLTIPMLRRVKQVYYVETEPHLVKNSFIRLGQTFKEIKKYRVAFLFMIAYFFYIDGVDTIIKMVVPYAQAIFGEDAISTFSLLGILLLVQVVAFPCALLFAALSKKIPALKLIRFAIVVYFFTVIFAFKMSTVWHVFILGGMVALVQGGIQALSRSYFARVIPKEKSNEFFGFYNIFGKFAAIIGPSIMALITTLTGKPRYSILGLIPLFVIGMALTYLLPHNPERIE